jgi:hypothetical protein
VKTSNLTIFLLLLAEECGRYMQCFAVRRRRRRRKKRSRRRRKKKRSKRRRRSVNIKRSCTYTAKAKPEVKLYPSCWRGVVVSLFLVVKERN